MAKNYHTNKTLKQKLQDIKDLLNGNKTIEALSRAILPPRTIQVHENNDNSYSIDGVDKKMSKEEMEDWIKAEKEKGPVTHVLHFLKHSGNDPLIEIEQTEATFSDRITWKETKTYPKEKNDCISIDYKGKQIEIQIIKPVKEIVTGIVKPIQPIVEYASKKVDQPKKKKQQPVKACKETKRPQNQPRLIPMREHEEFNRMMCNKIFGH